MNEPTYDYRAAELDLRRIIGRFFFPARAARILDLIVECTLGAEKESVFIETLDFFVQHTAISRGNVFDVLEWLVNHHVLQTPRPEPNGRREGRHYAINPLFGLWVVDKRGVVSASQRDLPLDVTDLPNELVRNFVARSAEIAGSMESPIPPVGQVRLAGPVPEETRSSDPDADPGRLDTYRESGVSPEMGEQPPGRVAPGASSAHAEQTAARAQREVVREVVHQGKERLLPGPLPQEREMARKPELVPESGIIREKANVYRARLVPDSGINAGTVKEGTVNDNVLNGTGQGLVPKSGINRGRGLEFTRAERELWLDLVSEIGTAESNKSSRFYPFWIARVRDAGARWLLEELALRRKPETTEMHGPVRNPARWMMDRWRRA